VKDIFTPIGKVLSVSMLGHGFAFVEMTAVDADRALAMMLDEAHPQTPSRY